MEDPRGEDEVDRRMDKGAEMISVVASSFKFNKQENGSGVKGEDLVGIGLSQKSQC